MGDDYELSGDEAKFILPKTYIHQNTMDLTLTNFNGTIFFKILEYWARSGALEKLHLNFLSFDYFECIEIKPLEWNLQKLKVMLLLFFVYKSYPC